MKNLNVKIVEIYKSFRKRQEVKLQGNLIILTGLNGSGKSHFLEVIKDVDNLNHRPYSEVSIDGIKIKKGEIILKSFKDVLNVTKIQQSNSSHFNIIKNSFSDLYSKNRGPLPFSFGEYGNAFQTICKKIGTNANLSPYQLNEKLDEINNLAEIWQPDDYFNQSNISDLFLSYIQNRQKYYAENDGPRDVVKNEFEKENPAPWYRINRTLSKLGFEYKFADDYELTPGFEIRGGIKLLGKNNQVLDYDIDSISDGEKTIFSLALGALRAEILGEQIKLLLLDEYDAPLNPSLIETFFEILNTYFTQKGTLVMLTTHSTDTIILAPDTATLYEVIKPPSDTRFQLLDKTKYNEYKLIHDKHLLDEENFRVQLERFQEDSVAIHNPLVITEGKTDWRLILRALQHFQNKNPKDFQAIKPEYFLKFGDKQDVDDSICGTINEYPMGDGNLSNFLEALSTARCKDASIFKSIRIGIYDSDNKSIKTIDDKTEKVFSFKIEPDNISIEFLFTDAEIKTELGDRRLYIGDEFDPRTKKLLDDPAINLGGSIVPSKAGKRCIIDQDVFNIESVNTALSKSEFSRAVFEDRILISESSWENFRPIFEFIEEKINSSEEDNSE